jgi:acyl-[acyl-carrier-protein]-phospholipid O-acyltransferase / long-chain-fatty-acid--[acyl-carrier-protein] ligase
MKTSETSPKSLPWLLAAQTQVVFTDNAAKLALIGLLQFPGLVSGDHGVLLVSLMAGLLVLPFILFAPVAGWLTDRLPKRALLQGLLLLQVVVVGAIGLCLYARNLPGAIVGFGFLALQSCLFSPAKQGILKELVGEKRLSVAVGWMETLGIAAILSGSLGGAWLFDHFTSGSGGDPWVGALWTISLLGIGSLAALVVFQPVVPTVAASREPFRPALLGQHLHDVGRLWKERPLRLAALGSAYFYAIGGVFYLTLIELGRTLHGGHTGSATEAGILFAILGAGVATGSLTAAGVSRKRIELGLVPIGSVGMVIALVLIGLSDPASGFIRVWIGALGFASGLFVVPINAYLQARSRNEERGRVIAAKNLLTNVAGIGAVVLQYVLSQQMGLSVNQQFLFLATPAALAAGYILFLLPDSCIALIVRLAVRRFYRLRVQGVENIPTGGALLACNHVSYLDALLVQSALDRPVRFMAFAGLRTSWWMRLAFRWFRVIPVTSENAREGIREAVAAARAGDIVCIFPEGQLTRTGTLQGIKKGFNLIARQANVPVVPAHLEGLWGSFFSFSGGRFFRKIPRFPAPAVSLTIGEPVDPHAIDPAQLQALLLGLAHDAYQKRPALNRHLGREAVRGLCRAPWRTAIVDRFPARRVFSRGLLLALAAALAQRWRREFADHPRIGIALPPGAGAAMANLACILAGKTPVNLNFTAGPAAWESALDQAGISTIVTADALKGKTAHLPWSDNARDLTAEIKQLGKLPILGWLTAAWILPCFAIQELLRLPRHGKEGECALLFTSGSSGQPKGVVLTHRNILGNVEQMSDTNLLRPHDKIMSTLPIFHSFGFTVTLWCPLLRGLPIVAFPSPLDPRKIIDAIRDEKATVFPGTATFLRPYLTKATPEDFSSLRVIVAGAEKVPLPLLQAFHQRFQIPVLEGYGLTETSPCLSINLPPPGHSRGKAADQRTECPGSVGRLLPGIQARILDPDSERPSSLSSTGLLQVKGPNIFAGYLGRPDLSESVLSDGWFNTGDIVRFDPDGFIHIVGRLSRFSKIGGEMVPHGTVEEAILATLDSEGFDQQPLAVVGIPDPVKGEELVLLTILPLSLSELRPKLAAHGIPNLWMPKQIRQIGQLPFLGSGKLDLKECQRLAEGVGVAICS